jgi:hypothetical protein
VKFKHPERSHHKRDKSPIDVGKVHQAAETASHGELVFSFRYLDLNDPDFNVKGRDSSYFEKLFERKKNVCAMLDHDFRMAGGRALRAHVIDFDKTSRDSFPENIHADKIGTPYQFALSANEHGRVHGLLAGRIFYVIWLDPGHKLYS